MVSVCSGVLSLNCLELYFKNKNAENGICMERKEMKKWQEMVMQRPAERKF